MKGLVSALGDSLTWGWPFGPEYSWARPAGRVKVLNFGQSGDTLGDMRGRAGQALEPGPDYLLVMGGTNDVFLGLSRARMEADLLAIAREAEDAGAEVLLGICPPALDGSEGLLAFWRARQRELAAARGWRVIDFFSCLLDAAGAPVRELFLDECHLTKEGYSWLRRRFLKSLDELMPSLIDFPEEKH